jgi:hypothetical protein
LSAAESAPVESGEEELRQRRAAETRRGPAEAESESLRRQQDLRLLREMYGAGHQPPPAKPWIIRTGEMEPAFLRNLEEDFNVMFRVLERTVVERLQAPARRGPRTAMGIDLQLLSGQRAVPNIYLENHGALFFMQVDFPLLPPEDRPEEEEPEDAAADTLWEQTRRELYGPAHPEALSPRRRQRMESIPYDGAKVEALKQALLEAIPHGTNIRGLTPEEWVTVTVFGAEGRPFLAVQEGRRASADPFIEFGMGMPSGPRPPMSMTPALPRTSLTLRVTKADLDALAEGQIDEAAFEERVSMLLY